LAASASVISPILRLAVSSAAVFFALCVHCATRCPRLQHADFQAQAAFAARYRIANRLVVSVDGRRATQPNALRQNEVWDR